MSHCIVRDETENLSYYVNLILNLSSNNIDTLKRYFIEDQGNFLELKQKLVKFVWIQS